MLRNLGKKRNKKNKQTNDFFDEKLKKMEKSYFDKISNLKKESQEKEQRLKKSIKDTILKWKKEINYLSYNDIDKLEYVLEQNDYDYQCISVEINKKNNNYLSEIEISFGSLEFKLEIKEDNELIENILETRLKLKYKDQITDIEDDSKRFDKLYEKICEFDPTIDRKNKLNQINKTK